jgi:hypothetical protein
MPPSHSCRCERCWIDILNLQSVVPSCWLLRSCLVRMLVFKICHPLLGLNSMNYVRGHPFTWATRLELIRDHPGIYWHTLWIASFPAVWLESWLRHFLAPALPQSSWFDFDCVNSVTQRWHQLLAGFRFEANGTHSSFWASRNLKACALGYLLSC